MWATTHSTDKVKLEWRNTMRFPEKSHSVSFTCWFNCENVIWFWQNYCPCNMQNKSTSSTVQEIKSSFLSGFPLVSQRRTCHVSAEHLWYVKTSRKRAEMRCWVRVQYPVSEHRPGFIVKITSSLGEKNPQLPVRGFPWHHDTDNERVTPQEEWVSVTGLPNHFSWLDQRKL